jgi:hypothetical protein
MFFLRLTQMPLQLEIVKLEIPILSALAFSLDSKHILYGTTDGIIKI